MGAWVEADKDLRRVWCDVCDSPKERSKDLWVKMFEKVGKDKRLKKMASRIDRLRCCGNGVVPQQAAPAWEKIIEMAGL